jgi:hypothetical protein
MKRTHPGGPRATWMDSEADQQDRKQRNQGALKSQKSALLGSHSQLTNVEVGIPLEMRTADFYI